MKCPGSSKVKMSKLERETRLSFDISIADLPDPSDAKAVFSFAMSFNGYEAFGSLEACSKAAREKSRLSVKDLRNELFFAARASRHSDSDAFLRIYAELLPLFRKLLGTAQT